MDWRNATVMLNGSTEQVSLLELYPSINRPSTCLWVRYEGEAWLPGHIETYSLYLLSPSRDSEPVRTLIAHGLAYRDAIEAGNSLAALLNAL